MRTVTRRSQNPELAALPAELREPVVAYALAMREADAARRAMVEASAWCSLRYYELAEIARKLDI
jgi:hypothetical protein